MCRKLIYLTSFVLLLVLAGNAIAQIDPATVDTGHVYLFDNVSGSQLQDDSANNNTGTIVGDPQVVDGLKGKALQFDGVDDGITIPDSQFINVTGGPFPNRTVIAVFKCADVTKQEKQTVFEEGGRTRGLTIYVHDGQVYVGGWNRAEYDWNPGSWLSAPISSNNWYAVALVIRDGAEAVEDDKFEMWMDGRLIGRAPGGQIHNHSNDNAIGYTLQNNMFHDDDGSGDGWYFEGTIDEIWILNAALTETELGAFVGKGTFQGNQAGTELIVGFPGFTYPDGLIPGTTYYWRIDEVNDAEPNSPWKGQIWSFTIPPKTAYAPNPADGVKFVSTDAELSWTAGYDAKLHHVYFGDNFDDVNDATVGLPLADATYTPGTLELDKVYYWRIDEFDGVAILKGNVWSFRTLPHIPITDPNLVAWWTLDEGTGTVVLDWSGHGHNGTFSGEPLWVDGYDGSALKFDGINDYVIHTLPQARNFDNFTVTLWARAATLGQGQYMAPFSSHTPNSSGIQIDVDGTSPGNYRTNPPGGTTQIFGPVTTEWIHLALVAEGTSVQYYYNGTWATSGIFTDNDLLFNEFIIGTSRNNQNHFDGIVDDLRVYDKALTQEEIQLVMRIDPLLAWDASPTNGSVSNLRDARSLSWLAGDNASQHDVYFSTDKDAVADANASDTTGVYRGRQGSTSYDTAQNVEWGGGPYYWRIDEYNTDDTISKGRIWTFTVADFIGIDDFEDYNTGENQIWYAWKDGLGYGTPGTEPYYAGNGTGSAVGDETTGSYMEETIVHGGGKSMPVFYDNNQQGKLRYSEVEKTLSSQRDWTEEGVGVLSLWFYGDASNAAEPLYVALNGNAVVTHDNPNAAQIETWTEWTIDLQVFADQGVNLANVNTIAIGLGNKNNPVAGGSGTIYIDDIRLYRPAP
jgi:hypothetical protein